MEPRERVHVRSRWERGPTRDWKTDKQGLVKPGQTLGVFFFSSPDAGPGATQTSEWPRVFFSSSHVGGMSGQLSKLSCRACPCLPVAVARVAGRWCFWRSPGAVFGVLLSFVLFCVVRTRGPVFFRRFFFRCSGTLVPCIRSHESAGHLVVYFVTGQVVGDHRFPWATILGANHHLLIPPTGCVQRDALWSGRCTRWLVLLNPTGATLWRHFFRTVAGRNLRPRRCGNFGFVSRHTGHRNIAF